MIDLKAPSTRRGVFLTLIGITVVSALIAMMAPTDVTIGFATNMAASLVLFWAVDETLAQADRLHGAPARREAVARALRVLGTMEEMVTAAYLPTIMCGKGDLEAFNRWPRDRFSPDIADVLVHADIQMQGFGEGEAPLKLRLVELLIRARRAIADSDQLIAHQDPAVIEAIGAFSRLPLLQHIEAMAGGGWPMTTFFRDNWQGLIEAYNSLMDAVNSTREDGGTSRPQTFYTLMGQKGLHAAPEKPAERPQRTRNSAGKTAGK